MYVERISVRIKSSPDFHVLHTGVGGVPPKLGESTKVEQFVDICVHTIFIVSVFMRLALYEEPRGPPGDADFTISAPRA